MAKRSRRRLARSEKDRAGCMWGLINLFDFRQGPSSTKLLSDRKRASGRRAGTKYSGSKLELLNDFEDTKEVDDVDDSRGGNINLSMTSVKILMEEEMSRAHPSKNIPNEEIERMKSELGLGVHLEKNYEQSANNFKVVSDFINDLMDPPSLETHQPNCVNPTERSSINFDLAAFMVKFYSDNHQCREKNVDCNSKIDSCPVLNMTDHGKHNYLEEPDFKLSEKQIMLRKALDDVADVFLGQKFIDTKHPSGAVQSKEFMDALEILNSNKELLLNLLQDPNSLLLKQIQNRQDSQVGKLSRLKSGNYLEADEPLEEIGSSGHSEELIDHKKFNKPSGYNFFRKKDKSKVTKTFKEDDSYRALNKIVVLKPSPGRVQNAITISPSSSPQSYHSLKCQESERVVSNFSLKEIKRRLKHVMGESRKEQHVISMDGILHRIPYGQKDSGDLGKQVAGGSIGNGLTSKTYYNTEHISQSSSIAQKRDRKAKQKEHRQNIKDNSSFKDDSDKRLSMEANAHPSNRQSFYKEAKKHLVDMLHTRDGGDMFPRRQISKSLGRLLSLPEYNMPSPRFSPGRDKGPDLSPVQQFKQDTATNHLSPLISTLEKFSCTDVDPEDEAEVIDSKPTLTDTQIKEGICIGAHLDQEGSMMIVEKADVVSKKECDLLDVHSESDGNELGIVSERCNEGSPAQSGLGSPVEKLQADPCGCFLPSSLLVQNIKDPESILEKSERPSPVSVLEPFMDDINSPGSTVGMHNEFPICPQSINFEEHYPTVVLTTSGSEANLRTCMDDNAGRFEYVIAVLEVSGLSGDEISNRWLSSDQLLDSSLFDEVELSDRQLSDDPKLLFDCTSEVLMEIQERVFSCTQCISFIKPNVRPFPVGRNLIHEVCRGIERHLKWQSPHTLDQIVSKDMDSGTWMDLRSEAECVVIEMGDGILEYLMEELALEMWD